MRKQRPDTIGPGPTGSGRRGAGTGFRPASRIGIFLAILLVTATALAATYLLLRESLLQHVNEQANEVVEQEIEQLIEFSETATDPSTASVFGSSTRLLDVYLSTRIPGPDESVVGIVDRRLIQMNRGDSTRRLEPDSPLLTEIEKSPDAAGIIYPEGPDSAAVHWGKVHLGSPEDPRPAAFVVLHHTDNDVAEMNHTLELLRTAGTMVFAISAVPALILALLLGWRRRWRPRVESTPEPPAAIATPAPAGTVDQTYLATLVHTNRQMQAPLRHLGRATRNQPVLAEAVQQLRQASDSLAGLSRMMQPGAAGEDLRLDSGELTWQLVQRIRQDNDREIRLASTATGQQVSVNPEQLRLALSEVVRDFPRPSRTGAGEVEFGTAFRGGQRDRILSLWLRYHDDSCPEEAREPDHPPLLQAVAEYHGGRAWAESAPQLGLMLGMDIPVEPGSR